MCVSAAPDSMGEMMSRSPVQMAPDTSSSGQLPLYIVMFFRSCVLSAAVP